VQVSAAKLEEGPKNQAQNSSFAHDIKKKTE
jgi:hypothetical protein